MYVKCHGKGANKNMERQQANGNRESTVNHKQNS